MHIRHYLAAPDLLSLFNASAGFLSVLMLLNGHYIFSAQLMLLAVIFDSLDGWVARKTKRNDEFGFGKNMDSLSDVISFGVAPGMFLCIASSSMFLLYINIVVALLIVICGILRLSRFNVLTIDNDIIARDKDSIVFVEVRSTIGDRFCDPIDSITSSKIKRLRKLALTWLGYRNRHDEYIRFDVIGVIFDPSSMRPDITYIKDAF